MLQYSGDDLLKMFDKLHIETGNINPHVINAWFDTDSENFLNWFCRTITEENYVTAQEIFEYEGCATILIEEEIEKEMRIFEANFPELFDYENNSLEIENMENMIDVLEQNLKDYDSQLKINNYLNQALSSEFSRVSSDEIKSHVEQETAKESCLNISNTLDEINNKSFHEILKYHTCLNNYDSVEVPEFINMMETIEFEEKFRSVVALISPFIKVNSDGLHNSISTSFTNSLSALQSRLFHSKLSSIAIHMEVESLNYVLKFLDHYNIGHPSLLDKNAMVFNIEFKKSEQTCMLESLEQIFLKQAEQYINQPILECLKKELNFYQTKLNYCDKVRESLAQVISSFVVLYNLYLLEKLDINSYNQFYKTLAQYIKKDIHGSIFREDAMKRVINDYSTFSSNSIENKFMLIGTFGTFLSKNDLSLDTILKQTVSVREEIQKLEKKHFSCASKLCKKSKDLMKNIKGLQDFLEDGPTRQINTICAPLQQVICIVNHNLENQNSSVKLLMQIIQKLKDKFSEDKWLTYRRQLWMHFIKDFKRMFMILEQLKDQEKTSQYSRLF